MKRDIQWWQVIAVCILIAGVALTIWSAQQQDQSMRNDLLLKTKIAESGISSGQVASLSGSAVDITSPEYQALKSQLEKIRASDPDIRFAYLMGQRQDGTIIMYADSELPESDNYSPPGQVYTEASAVLQSVFATGTMVNEGPLSDRWGTWVSGFIPVTDPATGRVIAVFGMDVDASDWNRIIFGASLPSFIATLLIVLLVLVSAIFQRRSEDEKRRLETSEEKFSASFHANPALMIVSTIEEGIILDVNESFLSTLGYSREEVIGKTVSELDLYFDQAQRNTILNQVRESGQVRNVEVKINRKDRELVDGSFSAITIDVAGIPRLFTVVLDRTESKRAEEAVRASRDLLIKSEADLQTHQIELETQAEELRKAQLALEESRDKYLDLYEFAPVGYLTLNDKALIVKVNLTGATLLGNDRKKLVNARFRKFIAEKDSEQWIKYFMDVLDQEGKQTCTLMLNRGDGSMFPARLESIRITSSAATPTVRVAISDISDMRKVEETLAESEKKIRALFDQTFQFIGMMTPDGVLIDANRTAMEFAGIKKSECFGKPFWDTPWWTHSAELQNKVRDAVIRAGHGETVRFEATHLAADGSVHSIDFSLKPVKNEKNRVIFLIPEGHDITERKQHEVALARKTEELYAAYDELTAAGEEQKAQFDTLIESERMVRESEERFNQLAEQSGTITWEVDTGGLYTYVSHVSETVWGLRPDELVGKVHFYDLHPESEHEAFKAAAFKIFEQKEPFRNLENTIQTKEGHLVWVSTNGLPLLNDDRTLRGYRGNDTDITELKRAEVALRSLSDRLSLATRAGGVGIWDYSTFKIVLYNLHFGHMRSK
jgi:PAS domain S-box-containing protein